MSESGSRGGGRDRMTNPRVPPPLRSFHPVDGSRDDGSSGVGVGVTGRRRGLPSGDPEDAGGTEGDTKTDPYHWYEGHRPCGAWCLDNQQTSTSMTLCHPLF